MYAYIITHFDTIIAIILFTAMPIKSYPELSLINKSQSYHGIVAFMHDL